MGVPAGQGHSENRHVCLDKLVVKPFHILLFGLLEAHDPRKNEIGQQRWNTIVNKKWCGAMGSSSRALPNILNEKKDDELQ